ncbi:hypothetical protein M427DRAFT_64701 [Gonapodya prolifera JEL478]|uniref:Uncharacterized protein n=1 Tax=Gonapodya prolifera (strain JEL478) TaxID=1344416 RepID=A0A138ZY15_GONPJ|nr:hypothetical protein M427DRAFT_64701 [Gonapodya prolifera JEL478]|eukprot:KXS09165.1 hypothetical protein M427DRAFT_64701 [Gonapodya prolifera JEL478]
MAERHFEPGVSVVQYPEGLVNDALNPFNAQDTWAKIQALPQTIPAEARLVRKTFSKGRTAHYPAMGIAYTLAHPSLWGIVIGALCCTLLFSLAWTIVLFAAVFPAMSRAIAAAGCPPWLAWIVGVIITLIMIFLGFLVCGIFLFGGFESSLFDRVIKLEGFESLMKQKRGWSIFTPSLPVAALFNLTRLTTLTITVPLNILPFFGTALYAWLNASNYAMERHVHYLVDFKHLDLERTWKYTHHADRRAEYAQFGFACLLMEMVPVAQALFVLTNTVGAALWACDIERGMMAGPETTDFEDNEEGQNAPEATSGSRSEEEGRAGSSVHSTQAALAVSSKSYGTQGSGNGMGNRMGSNASMTLGGSPGASTHTVVVAPNVKG